MCTLIVCRQAHPRFPLIIVSNRDEFYARPSAPPALVKHGDRSIVSPRDLERGGTWMGVASGGWFVGLTNQDDGMHLQGRDSRGKVVDALLKMNDIDEAEWYVNACVGSNYNPFNVVFGTSHDMRIGMVHGDFTMVAPIKQSVTVVANDCTFNAAYAHRQAAAQSSVMRALRHEKLVPSSFKRTLSLHVNHDDPYQSVCVHDQEKKFGTVSSSVVTVSSSGDISYAYADGPACQLNRQKSTLRFK